jgi:5-oxoprolinase (ATP-hydrolysing)
LTITDANVVLGRIRPEFFPRVFGVGANEALDRNIAAQLFADMAQQHDGKRGP